MAESKPDRIDLPFGHKFVAHAAPPAANTRAMTDHSVPPYDAVYLCPEHFEHFYVSHSGRCPEPGCDQRLVRYVLSTDETYASLPVQADPATPPDVLVLGKPAR